MSSMVLMEFKKSLDCYWSFDMEKINNRYIAKAVYVLVKNYSWFSFWKIIPRAKF